MTNEDKLQAYKEKRNFSKTPEPETGPVKSSRCPSSSFNNMTPAKCILISVWKLMECWLPGRCPRDRAPIRLKNIWRFVPKTTR